ncbi:hypothetical protein CERSUDRAFT_93440 [Gelatoporia subvermispora B]|uniref:Uncharacterized protein n=1 Tax=Ceriporiopsis subvermispora (strain B) TaxID=914234 RepID=M2PS13_CERS8|nr:hypothetical protein CERSUDRAFT_93440 [Gelatoporia subvermispora B]
MSTYTTRATKEGQAVQNGVDCRIYVSRTLSLLPTFALHYLGSHHPRESEYSYLIKFSLRNIAVRVVHYNAHRKQLGHGRPAATIPGRNIHPTSTPQHHSVRVSRLGASRGLRPPPLHTTAARAEPGSSSSTRCHRVLPSLPREPVPIDTLALSSRSPYAGPGAQKLDLRTPC